MTDAVEQEQDQDQEQEESRFVKLFKTSRKKLRGMKHIDAKLFAENFFFPLMMSLYDEVGEEFEEVYDSIDSIEELGSDVIEALAESPEIIGEMLKHCVFMAFKFDELFLASGLVEVNQDMPKQKKFDSEGAKDLYMEVGKANEVMVQRLNEVTEEINEINREDDPDGETVEEVVTTGPVAELAQTTPDTTTEDGEPIIDPPADPVTDPATESNGQIDPSETPTPTETPIVDPPKTDEPMVTDDKEDEESTDGVQA